jgi:gluconate 2-dehydrogenase alpha chain
MARRLPKKDVVIVGLGWTGSIMAHELTDEGLDVIAIERGPWRDSPTDFPPTYMQDELRYRVRHELFLRPDQTTFTFRNKMDQTALPIRTWGAFMPPNGVGGGGVHWNAETFRFLPSDFVLKTHLTQRYGASFLPADMTIQDWGVTYDDLEPHYDQFEYLCGTSGTAGNLRGEIQAGGNPFEGPRSRPYPTPAQAQPFSHTLFGKAARELGYKPFPQPSGNLSRAYTNPLGLRLGPCTYCGFCEWFGCANYSKASPQTTILPVLVRKSNFSARDNSEVTKINLDRSGEHATGVTFVDTSGEEWEQPADLVILSAYSLFNVQLLLLSGIGQPYDPVANAGVIGRNYTHQTISTANGFFDNKKFNFNPFIGSGSIGMCVDEFNGDNFDHGPHGFVGGGYVGQVQTGARPIESTLTPPGTPKWGAAWKNAVRDNYLSTVKPGTGVHGSFYAYRDVLSRSRSDVQGSLRPSAHADDHRFP